MVHIGADTTSTIISKGISAGHGQNTYRGLVKVLRSAENARNYTQCDSLLLGKNCGAHTVPYIEVKNPGAQIEHEARIMRGKAAELGGRHLVLAKEFLDGSDQHRGLPNRLVRQANRSPCS